MLALMSAIGLQMPAAVAQCQANEFARLTASNAQVGDWFGRAVALDGEVLVVGAPYVSEADTGAAYAFRFNGQKWVEEKKFLPSGADWFEDYGAAVAVSGDTILIGAPGNDEIGDDAGSVSVFRFDDGYWKPLTTLTPPQGASLGRFGSAAALRGGIAIIGAPSDYEQGEEAGAAYVFKDEGSTWPLQAKLLPGDGTSGDQFGISVAVTNDLVIVGADGDDDAGTDSGSAYIFRFNGTTWTEEAKLFAVDPKTEDEFGSAVAIEGEVAIVGAPGAGGGWPTPWAAYVFRYDGAAWTTETVLTASDGAIADMFGYAVALAGEFVVVGAVRDDDLGEDSGSSYVFRHTGRGWVEEAKLLASDGTKWDDFGCSVALSGGRAAIGAKEAEYLGHSRGAVYMIGSIADCNDNDELDLCEVVEGTAQDCQPNGALDECDLLDGTSQDCNGNDVPDACDIAEATSWDCNHNGVPDECDIADGTSEDVNGDGIPDECLPPGSEGLLPLLQSRTLAVYRHVNPPEGEPCTYYAYHEAADFEPYSKTIKIGQTPSASQQSSMNLMELKACGDATANGSYGGGMGETYEYGESIFDVVFGSSATHTVTLSGEIFIDAEYASGKGSTSVMLTGPDGGIMFSQIVSHQIASVPFSEEILLTEGMAYRLRACAWSAGFEVDLVAGYDVTLSLPLLGDLDGDGDVDVVDLLALLGAWGPCPGCPEDLNGDGTVDVLDLLLLLGNWT